MQNLKEFKLNISLDKFLNVFIPLYDEPDIKPIINAMLKGILGAPRQVVSLEAESLKCQKGGLIKFNLIVRSEYAVYRES